MTIFSKSPIKLALLAFIFSGAGAKAQGLTPMDPSKSQAGSQTAADHKVAAAKKMAATGKKAITKPTGMQAHHPNNNKHHMHHHLPAAAPMPLKHEEKMSLSISGEITPEAAFISGITPAVTPDNRQGYQFMVNNVFVNFDPKVKTDSSFVFSGRLRLEADVMTDLYNGTTTTPTALVKISRLYAKIESDYGQIQFGNYWGPQLQQMKGIWDVFDFGYESLDRIDSPIALLGSALTPAGYYSIANGDGNEFNSPIGIVDPLRANKISYESPSFSGFKLSAVLTPRVDQTGNIFPYSSSPAVTTSKAPRVQNSWFLVPSFHHKSGDFELGVVASYGQGTAVNSDGSKPAANTFQNPQLWNISADVKFGGFELAGAYLNSGTSLLSQAQINNNQNAGWSWNGVAAYRFPKSKLALAWEQTNVGWASDDNATLNVFTAYADYKLADGVMILISNNYVMGSQITTQAGLSNLNTTLGKSYANIAALGSNTTANVLYLGFNIRF